MTNKQIVLIFKMYKQFTKRSYEVSSISFYVGGTLIILICSLFVNAGATMHISGDDKKPNQIVMNTVIASASSGLL